MAQKTTLNVLYYVDATVSGLRRRTQAIWAKFQANNPDIDLQKEELFSEPFHQKMQAYIAAGTLPDVFYMWRRDAARLSTKALAKDLLQSSSARIPQEISPHRDQPQSTRRQHRAGVAVSGHHPQALPYHRCLRQYQAPEDNGFAVPKTYADSRRWCAQAQGQGHRRH